MKKTIPLSTLVLLLAAIFSPRGIQAQEAGAHPIPSWLLENWAARTQGSGVWITDNSAYQSEQEPFDAYGLHWEYGLGRKSLKGRLFCLKEGQDIGSVWQFLEYWDPEAGQARIVQIGSDGTVGQGVSWEDEDGHIREQQKFVSPEGGAFESGHQAWMADGSQHTQSYNILNGEWVKNRYYVWNLKINE